MTDDRKQPTKVALELIAILGKFGVPVQDPDDLTECERLYVWRLDGTSAALAQTPLLEQYQLQNIADDTHPIRVLPLALVPRKNEAGEVELLAKLHSTWGPVLPSHEVSPTDIADSGAELAKALGPILKLPVTPPSTYVGVAVSHKISVTSSSPTTFVFPMYALQLAQSIEAPAKFAGSDYEYFSKPDFDALVDSPNADVFAAVERLLPTGRSYLRLFIPPESNELALRERWGLHKKGPYITAVGAAVGVAGGIASLAGLVNTRAGLLLAGAGLILAALGRIVTKTLFDLIVRRAAKVAVVFFVVLALTLAIFWVLNSNADESIDVPVDSNREEVVEESTETTQPAETQAARELESAASSDEQNSMDDGTYEGSDVDGGDTDFVGKSILERAETSTAVPEPTAEAAPTPEPPMEALEEERSIPMSIPEVKVDVLDHGDDPKVELRYDYSKSCRSTLTETTTTNVAVSGPSAEVLKDATAEHRNSPTEMSAPTPVESASTATVFEHESVFQYEPVYTFLEVQVAAESTDHGFAIIRRVSGTKSRPGQASGSEVRARREITPTGLPVANSLLVFAGRDLTEQLLDDLEELMLAGSYDRPTLPTAAVGVGAEYVVTVTYDLFDVEFTSTALITVADIDLPRVSFDFTYLQDAQPGSQLVLTAEDALEIQEELRAVDPTTDWKLLEPTNYGFDSVSDVVGTVALDLTAPVSTGSARTELTETIETESGEADTINTLVQVTWMGDENVDC